MAFKFTCLTIPEVILVEPSLLTDARGYFYEAYKHSAFVQGGIDVNFVQENQSKSKKGVIRGLHYQLNPKAQGKLVRVISGEIFDVAVDMRIGSPTYGKWVGEKLSCENKKMLYVPVGFAHGFSVLSDTARVIYSCSDEYSPKHESGIIFNDQDLNIDWQVAEPVLADKDKALKSFKDAENNFKYHEA
jgi:dTDP-4-dehydrorhamnose 3,5-epimerase